MLPRVKVFWHASSDLPLLPSRPPTKLFGVPVALEIDVEVVGFREM